MLAWLRRIVTGEDPETRNARLRMVEDSKDPRRLFVWGVVAISYEYDPGYLTAHANTAIREWYSVDSAANLLSYTAQRFRTRSHVGYNQYRLCFLARAGHGAGLLSDADSWAWAFREAAVIQQAYSNWHEYAMGYLDGHLEFRASQGDAPEVLADYRRSILARIDTKQRTVWSAIPFTTPMS